MDGEKRVSAVNAAEAARELGAEYGVFAGGLSRLVFSRSVFGTARTMSGVPNDNLGAHELLNVAGKGDVLILCGVRGTRAVWGDLMATEAIKREVEGVIVDGPVRDVESLRRIGIPLWATGKALLGGDKRSSFELDVPVMIDEVHVHPGDLIVGDEDGIVVIASKVNPVISAARQRQVREDRIRAQVLGGEPLRSLIDLE